MKMLVSNFRRTPCLSVLCLCLLLYSSVSAQSKGPAEDDAEARKQIAALNAAQEKFILAMDMKGIMSLWAESEDDFDLLPGMAAMRGKKAIEAFADNMSKQMSAYKVVEQRDEFQQIEVHGESAIEWGTTYQKVNAPDGKVIETRGKMLLFLRRMNGGWKIAGEMWNSQ